MQEPIICWPLLQQNISDVNPLGLDTLDKNIGDDRVASELVMPVGEKSELVISPAT